MFELECNDIVKDLWHGVCNEIITVRLPDLTKVLVQCMFGCAHYSEAIFVCKSFKVVIDAILLFTIYNIHWPLLNIEICKIVSYAKIPSV